MAQGRTEKPTKRRLDKARREGRFPVSRELVSAVQFAAFVTLLGVWSGSALQGLQDITRKLLESAFRLELTPHAVVALYRHLLTAIGAPSLLAGASLTAVMLAAHIGASQLGFAPQKLAPDLSRLNPLQKLREFPKQGISSLTQAAVLLPVFSLACYAVLKNHLAEYLALPGVDLPAALKLIGHALEDLLWKAAFALLLVGLVDLFRQRRRHGQSLRMTKQEVREESKDTEGNPQIKGRIRRIQRDLARRNMMKEVPRATAVIVNPTHFSVAIRYELESMAAPVVVAKGKNYLALRIRQIATEHQVPIIENQPLAQALYKSAEVGQEIPAHLYRAVAEVLAYIFRLMRRGKS
jgi:flagellar biosynthetic protein FlhB